MFTCSDRQREAEIMNLPALSTKDIVYIALFAAVIAAMQARGFEPVDDNEADALALLLWAIEARGGQA
jgi:hypothetical protein